ncbi:MAG: hypothetical protein MZU79_01250 [Anaerotruncus sp.]|nr:hypothetical protein [Anaerotruncus sp.]
MPPGSPCEARLEMGSPRETICRIATDEKFRPGDPRPARHGRDPRRPVRRGLQLCPAPRALPGAADLNGTPCKSGIPTTNACHARN